jgi:hypothetical protein
MEMQHEKHAQEPEGAAARGHHDDSGYDPFGRRHSGKRKRRCDGGPAANGLRGFMGGETDFHSPAKDSQGNQKRCEVICVNFAEKGLALSVKKSYNG